MTFLIKQKIIHRDLKAENIFLNMEANKIQVKVGNFGFALHTDSQYQKKYSYFGIGTPYIRVCKQFKF